MGSDLRERIDSALFTFLDGRRRSIEELDGAAAPLVAELVRLLRAGGKRIRPILCICGYRCGGGDVPDDPDAPIVRAAAALELLHTMAIVHDDLIDGAKERRRVPSTAVHFSQRAEGLGAPGDPDEFGRSMAVLVGDVAAVWADLLLLRSGFASEALARAQADYHAMREEMAVGQFLDVSGAAGDQEAARRAARLKGGTYTVVGPLRIGAALAGGSDPVRACLSRFGEPLGEAFQLRDDLLDGDAAPGITSQTVVSLVGRAKDALDPDVLPAEAMAELVRFADRVAR